MGIRERRGTEGEDFYTRVLVIREYGESNEEILWVFLCILCMHDFIIYEMFFVLVPFFAFYSPLTFQFSSPLIWIDCVVLYFNFFFNYYSQLLNFLCEKCGLATFLHFLFEFSTRETFFSNYRI